MAATIDLLQQARSLRDQADRQLEQLRAVRPYLIDMSLRENPVGSTIGQTLADKLHILPQLRAFGMRNIHLGSLDYALPDELEVDDDFLAHLRDHDVDMNGCFAFTDIGTVDGAGVFQPSPSLSKLRDYGVPNTLHEIYLSEAGMAGNYDLPTLKRNLQASIGWIHANICGDKNEGEDGHAAPRILINIVDGCDAFAENLERTCDVLAFLAAEPIEGVSIEDDRGTYLPFQVGAYVAIARSFLPAPKQLLVHVHAGAGYENASVMEALLRGADGVWGGLPKGAAIIGHASLGELIANLVRIGNPHMADYRVETLLPLATDLQQLDTGRPVADDVPVLGRNAYRLTLDFFRQRAGRFMDLAPEQIGGRYGYRVCPLVSDAPVLAGRLAEVTGQPAGAFAPAVLEQMIRMMRRELRAGLRIAYDEPDALLALYERAGAALAALDTLNTSTYLETCA
jgi:hypothetical protein